MHGAALFLSAITMAALTTLTCSFLVHGKACSAVTQIYVARQALSPEVREGDVRVVPGLGFCYWQVQVSESAAQFANSNAHSV